MYNAMLQQHMLVNLTNRVYHFQPIETKQENNQDFPLDILQLVATDMPPIRNRVANSYTVQNSSNNAQNFYPHAIQPPQTQTYQKNQNRTITKRNFNQNGNKNKDMRFGRMRTSTLDVSAESGLDSHRPTPGLSQHVPTDQTCPDEFKGVKRLHEVTGNQRSRFYSQFGQYHPANPQNCTYVPRRSDSPQHNYKRRYHNVADNHTVPHYGAPSRGRRITGMFLNPAHQENNFSNHFSLLPDRFLMRAHLVELKHPPVSLTTGSKWDELSTELWEKFVRHQQSCETFRKKMDLWKNLYMFIKYMLQASLPRYNLYVVGSTMSGFGSNNSDVDMCLMVRPTEMDQRNEAIMHLNYIQRLLLRWDCVRNLELIQAKVPILKFRDMQQGLEVDLNCNNCVGIRNTHLLHCYGEMDWRVRPLVLTIKLWAHANNINDAKSMTISSYSLALMVIHFLQCGVSPPVLPCLHKMYGDKFTPDSDIHQIDLHEELATPVSENTQSLGELFFNFFGYYSNFNFSEDAISVRLGSKIKIDQCRRAPTMKNDLHQWKYLCIEEPFDQTNTARSVYDPDVFDHIVRIIKASFQSLNKTLQLESIYNHHSLMSKAK